MIREDDHEAAREAGSAMAELAGEQLAAEIASEQGRELPEDGLSALSAALAVACERLGAVGVLMRTLRTSEGCIVVRAIPSGPRASAQRCCDLTRGLLEALPRLLAGVRSIVIETKCVRRAGDSCMFTLLWEGRAAGDSTERLEGVDPPSTPPGDGLEVRPLQLHELREGYAFTDDLLAQALPEGWLESLSAMDRAAPAGVGAAELLPATARREPAPCEPDREAAARELRRRGRAARKLPWLRRRIAVIVLAVLVGAGGGLVVTAGHARSYSAQALLLVETGASSGATGARALAETDAALVPSDGALLRVLGRRLGLSPSVVRSSLSATAERGTGLFVVSYEASSPSLAVKGANAAAFLLSGRRPPGRAIAPSSVALVNRAESAQRSDRLLSYAGVAGALAGLLLATLLVLALERVDSRVDDAEDLSSACGCPAAELPSGISVEELAAALSRAGARGSLTLLPTSAGAAPAAGALGALLTAAWPAQVGGARPTLVVARPYEQSPARLGEVEGPAVLVVAAGHPSRDVVTMADRLRLVGLDPLFAVLCAPRSEPEQRRSSGQPALGGGPRSLAIGLPAAKRPRETASDGAGTQVGPR